MTGFDAAATAKGGSHNELLDGIDDLVCGLDVGIVPDAGQDR
jgi:hypothetical protein